MRQHPVGVERAAGREERQQSVDADGGHMRPSYEPRRGATVAHQRTRLGRSTVGQHARAREDQHHGRDRDAARDLRDPRVLPHQPDADLLRLADRVQPARHRPLAAQLLLRQLLRLVRGHPPARVRAAGAPVPRVRVDGGHLQLPARAQPEVLDRVAQRRARRQGRVRDVRRRDRGGGRRGRPRGRATRRPSCATGWTRRSSRRSSATRRACRARRTRSGARRPTRS